MVISLNSGSPQMNSDLPPEGPYYVHLVDIEKMSPRNETRRDGTDRVVDRLRFVYNGHRILRDGSLENINYRLTQVFPVYTDKASRLLKTVELLAPGHLQLRPDGSPNVDGFDTDDFIGYAAEADVVHVRKDTQVYANVEIRRSRGKVGGQPAGLSPVSAASTVNTGSLPGTDPYTEQDVFNDEPLPSGTLPIVTKMVAL